MSHLIPVRVFMLGQLDNGRDSPGRRWLNLNRYAFHRAGVVLLSVALPGTGGSAAARLMWPGTKSGSSWMRRRASGGHAASCHSAGVGTYLQTKWISWRCLATA